jgi:hypothetical protein
LTRHAIECAPRHGCVSAHSRSFRHALAKSNVFNNGVMAVFLQLTSQGGDGTCVERFHGLQPFACSPA